MDIISHGLWGGITVGRRRRRDFWLAFFFGVAPDLFSFGIFTLSIWLGLASGPDWSKGLPDPSTIPQYVHVLYNWTHSLLIFIFVYALVWLFLRRPLYLMLPWGLHIVMDIFTHSSRFFPTPFLWPVSEKTVEGTPWSEPRVFIPNLILLALLYMWFYILHRKRKNLQKVSR